MYKKRTQGVHIVAGAIGIEPTLRESESRVLPLHHAPVLCYYKLNEFLWQGFLNERHKQ